MKKTKDIIKEEEALSKELGKLQNELFDQFDEIDSRELITEKAIKLKKELRTEVLPQFTT